MEGYKPLGTQWDREMRNEEDRMYKELYEGVNNIAGMITDEVFKKIVDSAKLNWKNPVEEFNDLPSDAEIGDTRMVRSDGNVYRFDGTEWQDIQQIDVSPVNELDSRLSSEINQRATTTTESVDYYVSPSGDDEAEGSENSPFRSLSKVISMIPNTIRENHVFTINLMQGEWTEELNLEHIVIFGKLVVQGVTTDREKHKVRRVTGESLLGHTVIRNITTTVKIASGQSFRFRRCAPIVEVDNVKAESNPEIEYGVAGVMGLLSDYGSQILVRNSDFSGKRYGMRSNYLSRIFSVDNTGSGNMTGVAARWGGILSTYGTQPTGDWKNYSTESSGIIATNYGGVVGLPEAEIGLIQGLGNQDRPSAIKRYFIHSANLNINEDIPQQKRFRFRFKLVQTGYTTFRVKYGAQTSITSSQYQECLFTGYLGVGSYTQANKTIIASQSLGESGILIEHTGSDGVIDLFINPLAALSGRFGIDLEVTLLRNFEAPKLIDVTLEDRP